MKREAESTFTTVERKEAGEQDIYEIIRGLLKQFIKYLV